MPTRCTDTLEGNNNFLTEREKEVLQFAANGYSNKQIAHELDVTEDCIDKHSRNITAKLEAKNIKHAIAIGIRKGVIK